MNHSWLSMILAPPLNSMDHDSDIIGLVKELQASRPEAGAEPFYTVKFFNEVWRHFPAIATRLLELEEEKTRLTRALGFARSVILSGERWTDTCEREITEVLDSVRPTS